MKRLLILLPALFLAGCMTTAPVKMSFPEAPEEMFKECPDLKEVKKGAQLSDILNTVVENYAQYHECRAKMDLWIEWHKSNKKIYDEIK
jgi:PBP1b-binding outer membrane lipoprotein LpoB